MSLFHLLKFVFGDPTPGIPVLWQGRVQAALAQCRQALWPRQRMGIVPTIFQDVETLTALEPVKEGHGEGGFLVISAQKSA